MTAPPGTPRPTLPPPQPTGPTHPTPTGPGRAHNGPPTGPADPQPGPGQPPQPIPRGYTSAPFGQTGGRYGYARALFAASVVAVVGGVGLGGFGAALVGAWLALHGGAA